MPSLRRRHKVPTETGLTEAPETAHSRLTRRRSQRTFYAVTPTYWERYLARQTGRRDGRRGTIPDLILAADEVVRVRAETEAILAKHTGRDAAKLRHDTDRDLVLAAATLISMLRREIGQRSRRCRSFRVTKGLA